MGWVFDGLRDAIADEMRHPLTFAQFVEEIERRHGFAPEKRKTVIARVQQLQKLGLSKVTGRGVKATYYPQDVRRMSEVLDMLDRGLSPAEALRRVNGKEVRSLDYLR